MDFTVCKLLITMAMKCSEPNGKYVLVTGGANGIGKGCVEILAEAGWTVSLWDIDDKNGASVEANYPDRVFFTHCDVTNEEQIKNDMESVVTKFGKLDCLVNDVGIQLPYKTIDDYSTDDFRKVLEINLVSCFAMCKYALPHIRKVKGNIVNISSIVVEHGLPLATVYASAKAGVTTLTRCLAIDEAMNGVRVNAIAPGCINTPLMQNLAQLEGGIEKVTEKAKEMSLSRRVGEPRDIGKACLYLANDATFCNGSVLYATGGLEVGFGRKFDN